MRQRPRAALERLDLAQAAARVGLAQPQLGALVDGLLGHRAPGPQGLDGDAETLDQPVAHLSVSGKAARRRPR